VAFEWLLIIYTSAQAKGNCVGLRTYWARNSTQKNKRSHLVA